MPFGCLYIFLEMSILAYFPFMKSDHSLFAIELFEHLFCIGYYLIIDFTVRKYFLLFCGSLHGETFKIDITHLSFLLLFSVMWDHVKNSSCSDHYPKASMTIDEDTLVFYLVETMMQSNLDLGSPINLLLRKLFVCLFLFKRVCRNSVEVVSSEFEHILFVLVLLVIRNDNVVFKIKLAIFFKEAQRFEANLTG